MAHQRWRSILGSVFGVLAAFGVLASVLSVWAHEVLYEPRSVSAAVDSALSDPEITGALASYLTDQVLRAVPVVELVERQLPTTFDPAVPFLVGGARIVVHDGLVRLLGPDATRRVVVEASEQSHWAIMRVLDGGSLVNGVSVEDREVSVNLLPLVGAGLRQLQGAGLFSKVALPRLAATGNPRQQQRQLEGALGHRLPEHFGQLVVYRSDQLAKAGPIIARTQQALVLIVVALLAALVIAVAWLPRDATTTTEGEQPAGGTT